jgi:hypothetical protein
MKSGQPEFMQSSEGGGRLGVRAKLLKFVDTWAAIGKAYMILRGMTPEWEGDPPPPQPRAQRARRYKGVMHSQYMHQLHEEMQEGIIVEVTQEDCKWLSPTFLVPKKGGEWRKVMDCRGLNEHIHAQAFQMEDHQMARLLIQPHQYGVTLDITKAYHHVPVSKEMQPYLGFQYDGRYYQYIGMPFGVRSAPRIFTRIMR